MTDQQFKELIQAMKYQTLAICITILAVYAGIRYAMG
jgi:hypothetical protein